MIIVVCESAKDLCQVLGSVALTVENFVFVQTVEENNVDTVCKAAQVLQKVFGGGHSGDFLTTDGVKSRLAVKMLRARGADCET